MTCLICKIKGCTCLFSRGAKVCLLCALGPKCPLEKRVEIEDKRENLNREQLTRENLRQA